MDLRCTSLAVQVEEEKAKRIKHLEYIACRCGDTALYLDTTLYFVGISLFFLGTTLYLLTKPTPRFGDTFFRLARRTTTAGASGAEKGKCKLRAALSGDQRKHDG